MTRRRTRSKARRVLAPARGERAARLRTRPGETGSSGDGRRLVARMIVPREGGKAFEVEKGQIVRIIAIDGPQVCDFNAYNRHDFTEGFWSGGTRSFEGTHLTIGNRLWSNPPRIRPMFTIVADTVKQRPNKLGLESHDLLFSRCNRERYKQRGMPGHANCQDNLARAIRPYSLPASAVQDAFNIFMKTGVEPNGRLFYKDPDAQKGDYMELRVEMDCLISLSACPGKSSGPKTRRLGVEIYEPTR